MIYFRLIAASLRSQLQYRVSFLLDALGAFLATFVEFAALALAFGRFGGLGGWSIWQIAFLWGLTEAAFGLMDMLFSGFDPASFSQHVRRGTLDQILLRPVNLIVQIFASEFVLRRVGRILEGGLIFALAVANLSLDWTPVKIAYLPLVFASAVAFYGALFVFGATLSFWTTEALEIVNIFTYGGTTMASYPMNIYTDWLRRIFTYVIPTALIIYYPALFFFDLSDPAGLPVWASFLAPLAGFGLLALAFLGFRFGLRRYASTGA
ncbi:MAG: ABC-2 family transporter protein [Thermoflexales bacterium]|nr:ABC-2 family transporter protein [Thermoflexales bacterium]